jgi:hypothetical protein
MYKVRTLKSKVWIKRNKFPEIVKRLKIYLPDDVVAQNSSSIFFLAKKFGWQPRIDLKTGDIITLHFFEDSWTRESNNALIVMCKYIEPGGVIHIANDKDQRYWVYKFDGQWFTKTVLTRVFVDLQSKEEVADLFERAVEAAIKSGLTRKEMAETIKKNMVSEYLDV